MTTNKIRAGIVDALIYEMLQTIIVIQRLQLQAIADKDLLTEFFSSKEREYMLDKLEEIHLDFNHRKQAALKED